jgi:glycosyltransferase involved in cell wall biosynthesis
MRSEIELTVYFYSDATLTESHYREFGRPLRWDTSLVDGYRHRILPSAHATGTTGRSWRCNWDVCRDFVARRYDSMWIHGYRHPTGWAAAVTSRASAAALFIREEQTLVHPQMTLKRLAKQALLHPLFAQAFGLYIGEQGQRYFFRYDLRDDRLFPPQYCVDNSPLQAEATQRLASRTTIRRQLRITDDSPVVLFCGKFIDKKQPFLLLDAYRRVRADHPCWLVMAGDGPLRVDAQALIRRLAIDGVRMPGLTNQSELPAVHTAADLFVLPFTPHETWG